MEKTTLQKAINEFRETVFGACVKLQNTLSEAVGGELKSCENTDDISKKKHHLNEANRLMEKRTIIDSIIEITHSFPDAE